MSNFEGNDNQIVWQFLNKAQQKYFWAVVKNNIVKIMKEKAEEWGVNREEIDKKLEDDKDIDRETFR